MDPTVTSGHADPAASVPARRRIVLEDFASVVPEEFPDVAREIRTLRRILELNKRLARMDEEAAFLDAFLDGAIALLASGARGCRSRRGGRSARCARPRWRALTSRTSRSPRLSALRAPRRVGAAARGVR